MMHCTVPNKCNRPANTSQILQVKVVVRTIYVDNLLIVDNEESIIELSHRTAGLSVHIAGITASVEEISGDKEIQMEYHQTVVASAPVLHPADLAVRGLLLLQWWWCRAICRAT